MASGLSWKLKRYGRFHPGSEGKGATSWKIFEAKGKKPRIFLKFLDPGYLLVMQGNKSLDTISLRDCSSSLKVQQKSDNILFKSSLMGESRMWRMQFDGSSPAEAIQECSSAVKKVMEYMPVTTQDSALLHPDQPPAEAPPPAAQCQQAGQETKGRDEQKAGQGMLSVKQLAQHYLGETALKLPQEYSHSSLVQCDLKPLLRVCLLDPGFHTFVEKVESELKNLLDE